MNVYERLTFLAGLLLAVTLLWQDNSSDENGFIIEKTISGNCTSGFQVIAYIGAGVISFADNMGVSGNCYRVAAFNDDGISAYTNTVQVPPAPSPKPCKSKNCR